MHCWKTINIQHQYGSTRIGILSVIMFVSVFTGSYVLFNLFQHRQYTDHYFIIFVLALFILYPIHKLLHYITLYDLRDHIALRVKLRFALVPIFHIRLKDPISKNRYVITLFTPFLVINTLLIVLILLFPQYTHYGTLLLACHCTICLMDLLYVKNLLNTPTNAKIEETPRGYEILVPPSVH